MDFLRGLGFFSTCPKVAALVGALAVHLAKAGAPAALASLRILRLAVAVGLLLPLLPLGFLLSLAALACLEVSNLLAEQLSQNTKTSASTPTKLA